MNQESQFFLLGLAAATAIYLGWGFRHLAAERWQILASVPARKDAEAGSSSWLGTNFTYYGFFSSNAYIGGAALYLFLAAAAGTSLITAASMLGIVLLVCAPAARLIAQWVEGKKSAFTVGGASFLGIILAPWIGLACVQVASPHGHGSLALPLVAAASIAYTCGEGFGRLACISFGCCYGKPVGDAPKRLRPIFERWHFVFTGATKKVAYEGGMEGAALIPVQAITATVLSVVTIVSVGLFLGAHWKMSFLIAGIGSQLWRVISEFLRADDRGKLKFSVYQWMSLLSVPYMIGAALLLPGGPAAMPDVPNGLRVFNTPAMLLSLQLLWVTIFVYTGKSSVTGAVMSFHVRRDNL